MEKQIPAFINQKKIIIQHQKKEIILYLMNFQIKIKLYHIILQ